MELSALILRARQEEAERKSRRMGLTEEIADDNARRIALYVPQAYVLAVAKSTCKCGRQTKELEGLFLKSKHPRLPESRLVRVEEMTDPELPKELEFHETQTPYCLECIQMELFAPPCAEDVLPKSPRLRPDAPGWHHEEDLYLLKKQSERMGPVWSGD